MTQDTLLDFVKSRLEEGEVLSPDALSRLLAAANQAPVRRRPPTACLLAASLVIAACTWLFYANAADARRAGNLANVIDLLRLADGETAPTACALPENLRAWQDAPTQDTTEE